MNNWVGQVISSVRLFILKPLFAVSFYTEILAISGFHTIELYRNVYMEPGAPPYDARIRAVSLICAALFSFVLVMMDVISLIARIKFAGTLKRYMAAEGMLMMTDASGRGSIGGGELGRRVSEIQGAVSRAQIVEGLASAIVFLDVLVVCLSVTLLSQLVFIVLSCVYKAPSFYYFKNLYLDWGIVPIGTCLCFATMLSRNWRKLEMLAKTTHQKSIHASTHHRHSVLQDVIAPPLPTTRRFTLFGFMEDQRKGNTAPPIPPLPPTSEVAEMQDGE
ncbi:hypothetical protein HDU97_009036 [Phlyctochytrium planicorne]|nr:hypothetical protein HDU97_009036 [Phlyctochytrium planicorne]